MSKQKVTNMETSIEYGFFFFGKAIAYGLECHTHTHITV